MFDEYSEFYFAQEDHGNFLHVYVPGKLPFARGEKKIKWTGCFEKADANAYKKQAILFRKKLRRAGLLKDLPQRQIPYYDSYFQYTVAPMSIWELMPDLKDLVYIRNDVLYKAKHTLWFPLLHKLKESLKHYDYVQLTLPKLPQVMTEEALEQWYESNQFEAGFMKRLEKLSAKTMIDVVEDENCVKIKPVNHPFVNQPVCHVPYLPNEEKTPQTLSDQDLLKVRQQVMERDVYLLKGLTDSERKKLTHASKDISSQDGHQLHWIQWQSLNGQMNKDNAIVVTSNIKQMYQYAVQTPLESFLKFHAKELSKYDKPVVIELPIPYNSYRSTPIKKVKTKHGNRARMKQELQKSMEYIG